MNWTFDNVRIYVDKYGGSGKQIIPILQPLSGGSVVQFFGWETTTKQISGLIVGATDLTTLLGLKETATAYVLNSPEGTLGSYYLKNIKFDRLPIVYQTINTTSPLDCYSPVYSVDLDLQPV
jgi:hypothetical protein